MGMLVAAMKMKKEYHSRNCWSLFTIASKCKIPHLCECEIGCHGRQLKPILDLVQTGVIRRSPKGSRSERERIEVADRAGSGRKSLIALNLMEFSTRKTSTLDRKIFVEFDPIGYSLPKTLILLQNQQKSLLRATEISRIPIRSTTVCRNSRFYQKATSHQSIHPKSREFLPIFNGQTARFEV